MRDVSTIPRRSPSSGDDSQRLDALQADIEHAVHLLPTQGPISVFVHHNTLHPFEHLPFDDAVRKGLEVYGSAPYLSEERYIAKLVRGRIRPHDIADALRQDLGEPGDDFVGLNDTRFQLRLAMLEHHWCVGSDAEIRWLTAETDALVRFRRETPEGLRASSINETRRWVLDEMRFPAASEHRFTDCVAGLIDLFGQPVEAWSDAVWEAFTLQLLWRICHQGAHGLPRFVDADSSLVRHRDLLLKATGSDIDLPVNTLLIAFCAAFLDQGFAGWRLPDRDLGFFASFARLYGTGPTVDHRLSGLSRELTSVVQSGATPLEIIDESLSLLGVRPAERREYVTQTLLALRGWAGMLWQMETNAAWTVHPAPIGSLTEYLAVRLIIERVALRSLAAGYLEDPTGLTKLRNRLQALIPHSTGVSDDRRAYLVFQLAQVRGWSARELFRLTKTEWSQLVREIETFSELERRRIYHHAYERRYRNQSLDALILHDRRRSRVPQTGKSFQVVTCIDDREESFRRHIEEIDPACETLGTAGFFAVAMYYRGAGDAHFRPLCPVVVTPRHYVREYPAYSQLASSRQRAEARRTLGTASHKWHVQSRTMWGGAATALLGSLASIPMVTRILFPRATAELRGLFRNMIQPPPITELTLLREADPPANENAHLGYSIEEMTSCVERVLRDLGLTHGFAKVIIVLGHGSGSLNNPHESAYNCGACSGGRGGPNARSFAWMANSQIVREVLCKRGIEIPADTFFVGGLHNTCDEDVTFFDLDAIPISHRIQFEAARDVIDEARARNAHERSRRFESAPLDMRPSEALEHVQTRAEDLSEVRPEYNHAANALTIVGRRERTRGLFLDRRAFLSDYDPTQDDAQSSILARILGAVIPVCAGISLEYYFSCVDVGGYGCGSKLPHNIVSLLGVMEGAASDLRPGLSQQMIEIHEPLRNLFVIETTPESMERVIEGNASIKSLVANEWVQLAVLDPYSSTIRVYSRGRFVDYVPESDDLPTVGSSADWYRGQRDHLGFAAIVRADRLSPAGDVD